MSAGGLGGAGDGECVRGALKTKGSRGSLGALVCGRALLYCAGAWSVMKPIFFMLLRWAAAMAWATFS